MFVSVVDILIIEMRRRMVVVMMVVAVALPEAIY